MDRKIRLLFVCMGNICRSPAAEGVMRSFLEKAGLCEKVECRSAGVIGFHEGSLPDSRMRRFAATRGYVLTSRARQVTLEDLENYDWIFTMDADNMANIHTMDRAGKFRHKVRNFCDFCTRHTDKIVPDPYYGGDAGFEHVLDLLEDGCENLIPFILESSAA